MRQMCMQCHLLLLFGKREGQLHKVSTKVVSKSFFLKTVEIHDYFFAYKIVCTTKIKHFKYSIAAA